MDVIAYVEPREIAPPKITTLDVPFADRDAEYDLNFCPVCDTGRHLDFIESHFRGNGVAVVCHGCGLRAPWSKDVHLGDEAHRQAVENWNRLAVRE